MTVLSDDEKCFLWMWKRLGYNVKLNTFFSYSEKICKQLEAKGVMEFKEESIELKEDYEKILRKL